MIDFMFIILISASQILLKKSPEIQISKFWRSLSLDARIGKNLGFIQADSA